MTCSFSDTVKQRLLRLYRKSNPRYRVVRLLSVALMCAGVLLALYGVVRAMLFRGVCGMLTVTLGYFLLKKADAACGSPFGDREDEQISLGTESFTYTYRPVRNPYGVRIYAYDILYTAVRNIDYWKSSGMLILTGKGQITAYADPAMTQRMENGAGRRFYDDSPFEIMLSAEEAEEIVGRLSQLCPDASHVNIEALKQAKKNSR